MRKVSFKTRFIVMALCLFWGVWIVKAYAALSGGTITTAITSSSSLSITVSSLASRIDSLDICYFEGTSSDTTFAAYLDTTATDTTLTNLKVNTQYIVFLRGRGGAGSKISDKDTVHTYPIALGDPTRNGFLTRKLSDADSWPPTGSFDRTITLNGKDASDSTLVYFAKAYNGIDIYATQAGDSCVATIYAIPVYWTGIFSDYTNFHEAYTIADSVQVTAEGLTRTSLSLPVGRFYLFRLYSLTGNGKNADYEITLTSDGD